MQKDDTKNAAPSVTDPSSESSAEGSGTDDGSSTEAAAEPVGPTAVSTAELAIVLGRDRFTSADAHWPLTVKGNPHLLVAGLSGMGKTTCLLNLCKQMLAGGVRPIVFLLPPGYRSAVAFPWRAVRFIDFDGLDSTRSRCSTGPRSSRTSMWPGWSETSSWGIYPELGPLQGGDIRRAVKESFEEAGWGRAAGNPADLQEPPFRKIPGDHARSPEAWNRTEESVGSSRGAGRLRLL